ncbi:iron-containing alcohol dehydrogenase [Algihabitans sp.]|uniref:iron-containing alcohol dehydrogenase n=1 Tax=Algihabitans sp. TaxID=2821514 RepID=UPI003BAB48F3
MSASASLSAPAIALPTATFSYPTTIRFGVGQSQGIAKSCESLGIQRPLFVTDPGLKDLPMTETLLGLLTEAGLDVMLFTEVAPNPLASNVEAGLEVCRAGDCDGVVALGGGSALDCAKTIAFMRPQTRPLADFEDVGSNWKRATTDGILPILAIPTTAGTGSEVGRAAVIALDVGEGPDGGPADGTKKVIFHPQMLPSLVIEDPALTAGLPPALTAATGFDALAHCLEAYCSPLFHPLGDGIAVEGIRLIKDALPRVYADGADLEARGQMLIAASMGATAFQKGLGAIHALSHPIGSLYRTHHGRTNAVFMPYVLAFNQTAIEPKIERLAAYIGLERPDFGGFCDWIGGLRDALGIEHRLGDLGVGEEQVDRIVELALADPTAPTNPVVLTDANLRDLLRASFDGRLPAAAT